MKKLLLLAMSVALFSCSSDSDSDSSGSDSGVAYIKGKLDGTTFNYTFNNSMSDQYFYSAIQSSSSDGGPTSYSYGGMLYPMSFSPKISVAFDGMVSTSDPSAEAALFDAAFDNAPENYLTDDQYQNNERGVDVQYESVDGEFYNTVYGSQSGSSFNVTSVIESVDGGLKIATIKGTFSCKLYNSDNAADVIDLTNGSFKIIVREDN